MSGVKRVKGCAAPKACPLMRAWGAAPRFPVAHSLSPRRRPRRPGTRLKGQPQERQHSAVAIRACGSQGRRDAGPTVPAGGCNVVWNAGDKRCRSVERGEVAPLRRVFSRETLLQWHRSVEYAEIGTTSAKLVARHCLASLTLHAGTGARVSGWYIVVKTIKGRRYRYRQRTWREGKQVRTQSFSLGPIDAGSPSGNAEADAGRQGLRNLTARTFSELAGSPILEGPFRNPWDLSKPSPGTFQRRPELDALILSCRVRLDTTGNEAFYNPRADLIVMPPARHFIDTDTQSSTEAYYAVLLHELAHWTGRTGRTGRLDGVNLHDEVSYAREELVAEATAVIVLRGLGFPPSQLAAHATYFQYWLKRSGEPGEAQRYVEREAETAARFILDRAVNTTQPNVV